MANQEDKKEKFRREASAILYRILKKSEREVDILRELTQRQDISVEEIDTILKAQINSISITVCMQYQKQKQERNMPYYLKGYP